MRNTTDPDLQGNKFVPEDPIPFPRRLAKIIGTNESLILQHIFHLMHNPRNGKDLDGDGRKWIYNTLEDWKRNHFDWLSTPSVKSILTKLEKDGYILSRQPDGSIRTKYYRVCVPKIVGSGAYKIDPNPDDSQGIESESQGIESESQGIESIPSAYKEQIVPNSTTVKKNSKNESPKIPSIPEELSTPETEAAWNEWKLHLKDKKLKVSELAYQKQILKLRDWGPARWIAAVDHSIGGNWQAIYEDKRNGSFQEKTKHVKYSKTTGKLLTEADDEYYYP